MDAQEKGAYIMLLLAHYQIGEQGLPDCDKQLARIAGVTPKVWSKIKPILAEKFSQRDGFWVSERCVKVLLAVNEKSSQNSAKALKRHSRPPATAEPEQCNPNSISHKPKTNNSLTPTPSLEPRARDEQPAEDDKGAGVLTSRSNGFGGKTPATGFKIERYLDDDALHAAKAVCPGWDIYHIMRIYDEGILGGKRAPPDFPAKAFLAWIPLYTKGKVP